MDDCKGAGLFGFFLGFVCGGVLALCMMAAMLADSIKSYRKAAIDAGAASMKKGVDGRDVLIWKENADGKQ